MDDSHIRRSQYRFDPSYSQKLKHSASNINTNFFRKNNNLSHNKKYYLKSNTNIHNSVNPNRVEARNKQIDDLINNKLRNRRSSQQNNNNFQNFSQNYGPELPNIYQPNNQKITVDSIVKQQMNIENLIKDLEYERIESEKRKRKQEQYLYLCEKQKEKLLNEEKKIQEIKEKEKAKQNEEKEKAMKENQRLKIENYQIRKNILGSLMNKNASADYGLEASYNNFAGSPYLPNLMPYENPYNFDNGLYNDYMGNNNRYRSFSNEPNYGYGYGYNNANSGMFTRNIGRNSDNSIYDSLGKYYISTPENYGQYYM